MESLSLESQRQILYASLLRFAPEAGTLRNRALDSLVLASLLGSTESSALRVGAIRKNLAFGPDAPSLRVELIQEALERLNGQGLVASLVVRAKHVYFLTPQGKAFLGPSLDSAAALFDSVIRRTLTAIPDVPFQTAMAVCRGFLSHCFARFGQNLARQVAGGSDDGLRQTDLEDAFAAASTEASLAPGDAEALYAACVTILRSQHPDDQKLRFFLAQGYYFAQLVGLEPTAFNPLAEQAFAGSVFYLDSNVLLPRLLAPNALASLFDELAAISRSLRITLKVSRATLDEIRRVAADRREQLKTIVAAVPTDLTANLNDQIAVAFFEARRENVALTPDEFLEPFDHISSISQKLGLEIDERNENDILKDKNVESVTEAIQAEYLNLYGRSKRPGPLEHDVCHYILVSEARQTNPKTWFLTRDRGLLSAAARIARGNEYPLCFGLVALLQSVSPFVDGSAPEHRLIDVFSVLLTEQVFPLKPMFDVQELVVLAEMHSDILATPPERLVQALGVVKRNVLRGRPLSVEETPKVALELRKFLSASADEQRRALEQSNERLASEMAATMAVAEQEKSTRLTAEDRLRWQSIEKGYLEEELEELRTRADLQAVEIERIQSESQRLELRRMRSRVLIVYGLGIALFGLETGITARLSALPQLKMLSSRFLLTVVRVVGLVLTTLPPYFYLRRTQMAKELLAAVITALVAIGLFLSGLLSDSARSLWADLLGIGMVIAILLTAQRRAAR